MRITTSESARRARSGRLQLRRRLAAVGRTIQRWQRRTSERRELAELGPWQLRDIGLTDAEVGRECRKPFWRP